MVRLVCWCKERLDYIIPMLLLFIIAGYSICSAYGFLIFPDEYTYWAYAGMSAGYDWSDVTSLGTYYSYGYSLILFPILFFCKDGNVAYRLAIGANFAILAVAFIYLAKKCRVIWNSKEYPVVIFSAIAIFFAGHLFNAQMTLTETVILGLYIIIGGLLYRYLAHNELFILIFLLLALVYIYMVHMRTVGIVLSALVILLFHILSGQGKKVHVIWLLGVVGICFVISGFIKEWSYMTVFGGLNRELVGGNDYSGQLEKLRYIFTPQGFYDLFVHILGKLLYLGLATYGFFIWGIYSLIKGVLLTGKENSYSDKRFSIYVLLTITMQVMIGAVYLLMLGEISDYTYGRYNELILPFAMVAGFVEVWKQPVKRVWAVTAGVAVFHLIAVYLVIRQIFAVKAKGFCGYFMAGISWLYRENNFDVSSFYIGTYLAGSFLMVIVMAVILFARRGRGREAVLAAILIIEVATAFQSEQVYLQPFKRAAYRDQCLAEKIEELCEKSGNPRVVFRYGEYPSYIGILQFLMPDIHIEVTDEIKTVDENMILIFSFDDMEQKKWEDLFVYSDVYGHFTVLYNDLK